jgi:hypothetical protein
VTEKLPADFDVVLPQGPTEDGRGVKMIRLRPEGPSTGVFYPVEEGKPLQPGADVLKLSRRRGALPLFDVETVFSAAEAAEPPRAGPPKVVSDAYRDGWDAVFGRRNEEAN